MRRYYVGVASEIGGAKLFRVPPCGTARSVNRVVKLIPGEQRTFLEPRSEFADGRAQVSGATFEALPSVLPSSLLDMWAFGLNVFA